MNLNNGQQAAVNAINDFLANDKQTSFALQGGAGVGKTFTLAVILREVVESVGRVALVTPTHKAARVACDKLDEAGVSYLFKPTGDALENVPAGVVVVDTVAGLLGIRPMDFTLNEEKGTVEEVFGKGVNGGRLTKLNPALLIIDEVSMVSKPDFQSVVADAKERGAKVLAIGDGGQLPPVKKVALDFNADFDAGYTLREVVRQAKGSAIIDLAWKIRDGEAFDGVRGADVVKCGDVMEQFIKDVKEPALKETQRDVFIAYTNATVNAVQEAACQKVYGHGARTFKAGELVIATRPGYRAVQSFFKGRPSKFPKLVAYVQNADLLRVESFDESRRHPTLGVPVTVTRLNVNGPERTFESYHLNDSELADPTHPFNVESGKLFDEAAALEKEFKSKGGYKTQKGTDLDKRRKQAWAIYNDLQKQVLGFCHPFAQTSHKSQGSTYRNVYVATAELLRFSPKALYVAVTRASKKLYW